MKNLKKAMLITASVMVLGTAGTATVMNQVQQPTINEEVGASSITKFTKTNYKTTHNLNLRSSASTKGRVLVTIPKNTQVSSSYKTGSWYKVSYKGKTGFVSGSYLKKVAKKPTSKPAPKQESFKQKTFATTANLNVRSTSSTKGKQLTQIPKGKTVKSSTRQNGWYKVTYNKKTGWVSGAYLKEVKKPVVKPAPKPTPTAPAWMSKSDAEAIIAKGYTKLSSVSYGLYYDDTELGETFFLNNSNARAQLTLNLVNYNTALTITPDMFGEKTYKEEKKILVKFNEGILLHAQTQVGSANAEKFRKSVEDFVLTRTGADRKQTKNIAGKDFVFSDDGGTIIVKAN